MLKILSWNVNSIRIRTEHLLQLVKTHNPDIICLQELKCMNSHFPYEALEHLAYNLYIHGQKALNGVAILSKIPAEEESKNDFPDNPLPEQARFIENKFMTEIGLIRVISLYVPNGGDVGSENFAKKLAFYDSFYRYISSTYMLGDKIFICSDFNVAPFDIDIHDPKRLQHSTCFTYAERQKLRRILNAGFVDNFRIIHPHSHDFSWWDYRGNKLEHNMGMRIDSILSSACAVQYLTDCFIDNKPRFADKPSDHAPVIACYTKS